MGARIVITGAAGFIGSHLAEHLIARGNNVIGIDNLLTGSLANIAHLSQRDFLLLEHDVTRDIHVDGAIDLGIGIDYPESPVQHVGRAIVYQARMFENFDYKYERQYRQEYAEGEKLFRALGRRAPNKAWKSGWVTPLSMKVQVWLARAVSSDG